MATAIRVVGLAGAFALITIAVGWWAVAAVGVLWGMVAGSAVRRANLLSGLAAGVGWFTLLAVGATRDETGALMATVSRLFSLPAPLLVAATVGLGLFLGFLGSWSGSALRSSRRTLSR